MGKREHIQLAVKSTEKIRGRLVFPLIVQPKLNGLRCYEEKVITKDLFSESTWKLYSSESNEYYIPHIQKQIAALRKAIDFNFPLDGELYIHGEPLNRIVGRVPKTNIHGTVSVPSIPNEDLEYHIFDVISKTLKQTDRTSALQTLNHYISKNKHLYPNLTVVPSKLIYTLERLEEYLEECIKDRYEGIIMRYPKSVYSPGSKKVKVMLKWKKFHETECKIIDILSEGMKNGVYVLKFLLKNDKNNETFLCNAGDDDRNKGKWSNDYKKKTFNNKLSVIGELATVKFYERSGVTNVPFHGNVVAIRNYE